MIKKRFVVVKAIPEQTVELGVDEVHRVLRVLYASGMTVVEFSGDQVCSLDDVLGKLFPDYNADG